VPQEAENQGELTGYFLLAVGEPRAGPDQRYRDGSVAIGHNSNRAEAHGKRVRVDHVVGGGTYTGPCRKASGRESQNENQPPRMAGPEVNGKRSYGHSHSFQVQEEAW
jgi:hypothetical protein